jgi:hypothetical protein
MSSETKSSLWPCELEKKYIGLQLLLFPSSQVSVEIYHLAMVFYQDSNNEILKIFDWLLHFSLRHQYKLSLFLSKQCL